MRLRRVFATYYAVASAILITIVIGAYLITNTLNTGIMLGGWDTAYYAWHAKTVIQYGPLYLMQLQSYSYLYTELVAFFGFISGSVVVAQRTLPVVLGMLSILLFALISYRISNDVRVAGLTAILTSLTVGTLHLVSEYHRNHMAYVLGLSAFLLLAPKSGGTISNRRYLLVFLLFLTAAATQSETFALFSLALILAAIITKDWRRLVTLLFSSTLALGIILLSFPNFLARYFLKVAPTAVIWEIRLSYEYLIFWTIGSWILLPIAFFGMVSLYRAARRKETRAVSLPVFVLSILLIIPIFVLMHTDSTDLNRLAQRAILLLPIPIILAIGIEQMTKVMRRKLPKMIKLLPRKLTLTRLLTIITIISLTYTSIEASFIIWVPLVEVSGYSKIVVVRQYLQSNNLEAPIFMFTNRSLWNSDLYRAYVGIEIGEHLAYFGDLENLIELLPTEFSYPDVQGEIANFTSVRYLEDMKGDKKYLIYPQKAYVRNISDLRLHPLVYITPELWDAPVPFYVEKFQVADDIYVVPSLTEIEDDVVRRD